MQIEKWLDIRGYEGLYEVSNTGKVRNMRTGRILSQALRCGYYHVSLYINSQVKHYRVNRLVLCTFTNKELDYSMQAGHINECRTDNRLENLEWCTSKANNNMPLRKIRLSKAKSKRVIDTRTKQVYARVSDAIRELKLYNDLFYKLIEEGVIAYI